MGSIGKIKGKATLAGTPRGRELAEGFLRGPNPAAIRAAGRVGTVTGLTAAPAAGAVIAHELTDDES